MEKSWYSVGLVRLILFGLAMSPCWGTRTTPMHKVQFTQKGYIQFLRWELPVPEITEFTFCLWLQSDDLTHPHSMFSYSKDEKERLVRAWIAPRGRSVHLEIGGMRVFETVTEIRENRWYHFCVSWENETGRYGLWINGRVWAHGSSVETIGHAIPKGGDIVVGQEYTDFDKGLEDGIEGAVFGFNLLLASAFEPLHDFGPPFWGHTVAKIPTKRDVEYGTRIFPISKEARERRYADHAVSLPLFLITSRQKADPWRNDVRNEWTEFEKRPLGLQLVKLSYVRCEIGRGSPFIGGSLMLISWTRTPVRVFGGALLKNVGNECGMFPATPEGL
ncbi:adhesion G-protein coupled receptor D2-like [Ceratina calcarata]|uniref:Adhesion G-protein coupled receptor D2-like n=1 Tax=Ceratina calcarata TaxID=156304 RepID=A0AAJ7S929_9HYME|nr:adhesion G-protein coupled receptor D2-like [Ceratina calcarata]